MNVSSVPAPYWNPHVSEKEFFTGDGCEWPGGAFTDVWTGRKTWIQQLENSSVAVIKTSKKQRMVWCQVFLQSYISSCSPTYFLRTSSLLPWFLKCGRIQMRCWNFGRIYKKVTTQDVRACHCPLLCTRWREEGSAAFKPTACQVFRKQHLRWREAAWLPLLLLGLQCKLAFHISELWLVAVNMALAHALAPANAHSQAFKQKVSRSAAAARSRT